LPSGGLWAYQEGLLRAGRDPPTLRDRARAGVHLAAPKAPARDLLPGARQGRWAVATRERVVGRFGGRRVAQH